MYILYYTMCIILACSVFETWACAELEYTAALVTHISDVKGNRHGIIQKS